MKSSFPGASMTRSGFEESEPRREGLQAGNANLDAWPWSHEEEAPFKGLPPLPKHFREPDLSPLPLCENEAVKAAEGSCSSLQEKITWVHGELLSLRLADLVLFKRLYTLALEIQDLKELQQEMEAFSKEDTFTEDQGQVGEADPAMRFQSAASFELTI